MKRLAAVTVGLFAAALLMSVPAQAQETCDPAYYLAVRGSGEQPQGDAAGAATSTYPDGGGMGPLLQQQFQGLSGVTGYGIVYPAVPVETTLTGLPAYRDDYAASVATGAAALRQTLRDIDSRCGSQSTTIVVTGYSQGADVVNAALAQVQNDGATDFSRVNKVVVFGDPSRLQGAMPEAIATRGQGVRRTLPVFSPVDPATDAWIADHRTIFTSFCAGFDAVCDTSSALQVIPGLGLESAAKVTGDVHVNYYTTGIDCAATSSVTTPTACGATVIANALGSSAPTSVPAPQILPADAPIAIMADLGPAQGLAQLVVTVGPVSVPVVLSPDGIAAASVTLPPGTYTATVGGVTSMPFEVAAGGQDKPYVPIVAA
ncbi:cutinase [Rhodococcoides trifolii]|uniref:Cutinase n=1 Tax=Rhodococcoides trifolii TaxID=908250 RepID=A0A917G8V7_9NOCA|nr:cutinase family protein [Rhodococcus trifolii]GGG29444.1 cutinase [Rhodococcus trifolii]